MTLGHEIDLDVPLSHPLPKRDSGTSRLFSLATSSITDWEAHYVISYMFHIEFVFTIIVKSFVIVHFSSHNGKRALILALTQTQQPFLDS
jgi:hypothetical protein